MGWRETRLSAVTGTPTDNRHSRIKAGTGQPRGGTMSQPAPAGFGRRADDQPGAPPSREAGLGGARSAAWPAAWTSRRSLAWQPCAKRGSRLFAEAMPQPRRDRRAAFGRIGPNAAWSGRKRASRRLVDAAGPHRRQTGPAASPTGQRRIMAADGLSKRMSMGHRALNGDVAERLKALVC